MWNIPNMLTLFRIFLVPLLVVVLLTEVPDKEYWGLGIFLLAALTDALDGIIARRTDRITTTGAMLDPIADKLLMSAAFISLVELQQAPAWMVTLIVGREFAVTALRLIALSPSRQTGSERRRPQLKSSPCRFSSSASTPISGTSSPRSPCGSQLH